MLKRGLAILLLFAMISTSSSRLFVYAGFSANEKYIATALCMNKARPWMHCNGKCYLMKKLLQADERQKNEDRQSRKNLFQESIIDAGLKVKFHTEFLAVILTPYIISDYVPMVVNIFQPPG